MFCPNCGAKVSDESKFCAECGAELKRKNGSDTQATANV
ncbi:MAG: zinc-ribbon domain-containing protein, partial [Terriglobia bacterium]